MMKKLILTIIAATLAVSSLSAKEISKQGFLTTDYCVERGHFTNCKLDNYHDPKQKLVLYVHDEQDYYFIDASHLEQAEVDEGFARNGVTITGKLVKKKGHDLIVGKEYKGPPPPAKSFFKGCL